MSDLQKNMKSFAYIMIKDRYKVLDYYAVHRDIIYLHDYLNQTLYLLAFMTRNIHHTRI